MGLPRTSVIAGALALAGLCMWTPMVDAAGPPRTANQWGKIAEHLTGGRNGSVLLTIDELDEMLLLGGGVKGAPYVQAFNAAEAVWKEFSAEAPKLRSGMHPYYQSAYDTASKTIYCLSGGPMFSFNLETKQWKEHGQDPALDGLSWHAVALDPKSRKLVVVGADKKADNIGWTRTVILDLESNTWAALPLPPAGVVKAHQELVAAKEAVIDLVGATRMAWYRDPKGVGSETELSALPRRCEALRKTPGLSGFAAEVDAIAGLLRDRKTLDALKGAKALQRKLELLSEERYPVPPSRRNSPLVFDPIHKAFVLFGGDHEAYLGNDTWILDLAKQSWRRAKPDLTPSPRAGHALVYLPKCGRIALFGGYLQSNSTDYGSRPWTTVQPQQMWLYDVTADRWDLLAAWQAKRGDASVPPNVGHFYGYSAQWFSPPALAADAEDRVVLVAPAGRRTKSSTWTLTVDPAELDAVGRGKLGTAPNQRLYRKGRFLSAYGEVTVKPKPTGLDSLPANRWVKLPPVPRNVAYGCRKRDWGTAAWDAANEEIILWGGGHCVRSASVPIHYSPVSGRMIEGYDADEPYGGNGGGGFGSSIMNRPWVYVHAYSLYAYDPRCSLIVTATGFLYDPARMDWLRMEPVKLPYRYGWSSTVLETSANGVVAWALYANEDRYSLFLFDEAKGWRDLKPKGKLFRPYVDSEGMTHDTKRNRMLLGWGGGYQKSGDGSITAFDFKAGKLEKLTPANADLGRIRNTREMVYVDHADSVVFGEVLTAGEGKAAKRYTRIYDCAENKYVLLDAGPHPPGRVFGQGWLYDAKRKLIYVLTTTGDAFALRFDPKSAVLVEQP